ncbi:hypothetical protein HY639_05965 [Candidatus Woesearchaeota archaeon]|nr:hypothetical protein [Candidatus Woesearchaeota archaeon]
MDLKQRFSEMMTSIPKDAPIAILHDTDADGICSAVLIAKALVLLGHKHPCFLQDTEHRATFGRKTLMALKKKKVQYLFTTDKAVDQDPTTIRQAEDLCTLLIFDHHQLEHDVTSPRTLLIKPQLFSPIIPSQYPSSKLVYDFFEPLVSLRDSDWLCVAGIILDASYRTWKPFVDDVHKRYHVPIPSFIFSSPLARVGQYITTTILYNGRKVKEVLAMTCRAKGYQDVIAALQPYDDAVRAEITKWMNLFEQRVERYPELKLYWCEIDSPYPITSIVSTRISMQYYPHDTVVLVQKLGRKLALSLRRQDSGTNCIELVRAAIVGIPQATGGGHIPAAGGQALYKDKENIKKQLLSFLTHKPA